MYPYSTTTKNPREHVSEKMKNSLELKHRTKADEPQQNHRSAQIQVFISVGDPDLDPQDLAFRIRIHYSEVQIWIWILPFSHKGVKQTEIMLAK
jgi:hypothetical protein